ncbi:MAG: hypothetical protein U5L75_03170 [Candidatus Campbellbacteria bacterium]|nr:hypothetical protein [Candidatus Campbellbacteria bacterium]
MFVIAGLFMTLHITKNLSGKFGKMADNAGKAALGMSLGVATGGMALAGRRTIGTQASRLKENANLQARAEEGGARGISARMALGAADRFSKSSFDPRTTSLGKIATKNLEKQGLKNAGVSQNAGKGGVQKGIEEAEKAAVETSKQYQATPKEIEREKQRMLREAKQAEEESKNTIYASRREEKLKRAQQLRKEASEYGGKDITARRQEAFARRLEKQNWLKRNIRNRITLVGAGVTGEERIDKKRAAAVRKNLKKSKPEQLLEELSGHLKEDKGSDKEDEEE